MDEYRRGEKRRRDNQRRKDGLKPEKQERIQIIEGGKGDYGGMRRWREGRGIQTEGGKGERDGRLEAKETKGKEE